MFYAQAWGGVGVANGQGILTRPFISGGWTWTGFDYRGEPTPDSWPDVNSHFGIMDMCGFPKDRCAPPGFCKRKEEGIVADSYT
jgi:beta-galactosidase